MGPGSLALARLRTHRGLIATFAVVTGVTALMLTTLGAYLAIALPHGVGLVLEESSREESTWTATVRQSGDAEAQAEAGDAIVREALAGEAALVQRDATTVDGTPYHRWTVTPDLAHVDSGTPAGLAAALEDVERRLGDDVGRTGVIVDGGLGATLASARDAVDAVVPMFPVAFVLVVVCCLIVLSQFARLVAVSRMPEHTLLRARGASLPQVARGGAVEAAVLTLPAVVTGVGGGLLVADLLAPGDADPGWRIPLGAGLVAWFLAAAVLAVAVVVATRRSLGRTTAEATGRRTSSLAGVGAFVLLVLAAAVAIWRLRTGTPASGAVDGFLMLGPSLALLASCLLGLGVLGRLTEAVASLLARHTRGIAPVLAARQVARHVSLFAAPTVALTLAVGTTVVAASYAATADGLQSRAGAAAVGADVRFAAAAQPRPELPSGVSASVPVLVDDLTFGDGGEAGLLALPPDATDVVLDIDGRVDTATLDRVRPSEQVLLGVELPREARTLGLTVRLEADGFLSTSSLSAWLRDDRGVLVRSVLGAVAEGGRQRLEVDLPEGFAPATLEALDLTVRTAGAGLRLEVLELRAGGATLDAGSAWLTPDVSDEARQSAAFTWSGETPESARIRPLEGLPGFEGDLPGFDLDQLVRLVPDGQTPEQLPAVVSSTLARSLGIEEGDTFEARSGARQLAFRVDGILPVVPGASSVALAVDLALLTNGYLRTVATVPAATDLWLAADDPAAVARELVAGGASDVRTATDEVRSQLVSPAADALWLGAIGTAVLAALAMLAAIITQLSLRRRELPVLRGLGLPGGVQAWGRLVEVAIVAGMALVLGAVTGSLVTLLTVDALAVRVAPHVPAILRSGVSVSWPQLGLLLAATFALIAVVALGYALAVRRQVARTDTADLRGVA